MLVAVPLLLRRNSGKRCIVYGGGWHGRGKKDTSQKSCNTATTGKIIVVFSCWLVRYVNSSHQLSLSSAQRQPFLHLACLLISAKRKKSAAVGRKMLIHIYKIIEYLWREECKCHTFLAMMMVIVKMAIIISKPEREKVIVVLFCWQSDRFTHRNVDSLKSNNKRGYWRGSGEGGGGIAKQIFSKFIFSNCGSVSVGGCGCKTGRQ